MAPGSSRVDAVETLRLRRGAVHQPWHACAIASATGIARPVLYVRNAFGVVRRKSVRLTVPEVTERPSVEVLKVAEAKP